MFENDEKNNQQTTQEKNNSSTSFFQSIFDKFNVPPTINIPNDDPNETGWDRIKNSWQTFNRGEYSVEMAIILNSTSMGAICGFTLGAFTHNRDVFESFIQKHNTNVFQGKYKANRQLADTMFIELFKRSTKHAIRYGLFTGSFVGLMTLFATYRNDLYYSDCAFAGAITGIGWKAHLGPQAALVNATVGSMFGLIFAALIKFSMRISGTSIKQMRYANSSNEPIDKIND